MPRFAGCAPILVCFVVLPSLGAPPSITLEQLEERARRHAPDVQLALRALAEAEAAAIGLGVALPTNPHVNADARHVTVSPAESPRAGYSVSVDAVFEVSGVGTLRLKEAQERVAAAQAELDATRVVAIARVRRSWVERQCAMQRVQVVAEMVAVEERVAAASKERERAGAAASPEVATVAVELAAERLALSEARSRLVAAEMELRMAVDLPADEALPTPPAAEAPSSVGPLEPLLARAQERRAELHVQRRRLEVLEATRAKFERDVVPKVGVLAGYDSSPASAPFGFFGLTVELPVAQRNQGPLAVVAAQRLTEGERLALLERAATREVTLAWWQLAALRERLDLLATEALPAAQTAVELIDTGWRAGRFDIFKLTAALRELLRVRLEQVETLRASWLETIELTRLSGGIS